MYVHLGGDTVIRSADMITILDYNHIEQGKAMESFLTSFAQQKKLLWISEQTMTKSIVVTDQYVYGSPISSLTLLKRTTEETYR
ncbi:extracellular matrix regulator RemB [Bacillus horti]|uniref:DUF370 domain-containing protein n=1 Tax=Caldalkalibacillus horti TaxID=77523 RepID=A0ABT9W1I4_9BACI|nr:extracellular matrix/biofilm biosynthesis regulator RemA family protein [Bacillus horti]MDQ0167099.1 hypothetical protein [Bacillus horti]